MDDSAILVLAGGLSGVFEGLMVQPFDMVKTRHQLNTQVNRTVFQTLFDLYKEGGIVYKIFLVPLMSHFLGVFRWYRGMASELVGIVPKSSGMYAGYEIARKKLAVDYGFGDTTSVATAAGFFSGIPESLIVTPTQVIKVRLQAKEHLGKYKNSLQCLQRVVSEEGIQALYIGIRPTLWRNCVFNTVYFGFIHVHILFSGVLSKGTKNLLPKAETTFTNLAQTLFVGFFAGIIATCFNIPFDVVKSRFQSQLREPGVPLKYRSTLQSLALIAKEEGLPSCYKGLYAKCYRMGIGGSVAMAVFEAVQIVTDYKKHE